jgi:hypothetical protein
MTNTIHFYPDNIYQYPEVWKEMESNFHEVMIYHVSAVRNNLQLFIDYTADARIKTQLEHRSTAHDGSKWLAEEFEPYVWRYWRTKWNKDGRIDTRFTEAFESTYIDRYITKAVWHHVQHNRHHPEYHLDHDDMNLVDLMEMVSDWYAMSEEFGTNIDDWVAYTVPRRYHFSPDKVSTIHQLIEVLRQKKNEQ